MMPSGSKGNLYQEAYTLGPLVPDSSYEAKVSAKNSYGWSDQSQIFNFYTQGKGENETKLRNRPFHNFGAPKSVLRRSSIT